MSFVSSSKHLLVKIDHFGLATRWPSTSLQQKMQSLFSIKKKANLAFEGGLDGGHLPGGDRYALWVEQGVTLKSGTAASYCFSTQIGEIRCCLRSASVNSSFYLCAFQLGYTSDSWTEGGARGKVEVLSCTWKVSQLQLHKTLCEVLWWNHSRSVTKNLTPYRFNSAGWGLDGQNAEIHSFPTMYIMVGGKWGRNGSKQWFSPKKWYKNSFFEYHDSGSSDFGLGWDPKF